MSREKTSSGGGVSIQTLLISSLSAVAAAIVVPLFWQKGTIVATAMTPIIVALANEALRRPAERISSVAPRVARRTATGVAIRRFDPQAAHTRHPERVGARGAGPERFEPHPAPERASDGLSPDDPFGLRGAERRRSWWKAGLITGIVAFVVVAAVVTASELAIFGGSITGHNERTSLFGGTQHASKSTTHKHGAPRATTTPGASATPAPKSTPTPTPTPTATTTPAPTATSSPSQSRPSPTP